MYKFQSSDPMFQFMSNHQNPLSLGERGKVRGDILEFWSLLGN
jgi:hypothetical protein